MVKHRRLKYSAYIKEREVNMCKVFYMVSSLYPYYYYFTIVQDNKLVASGTFEDWRHVETIAKLYNAELIFDGII